MAQEKIGPPEGPREGYALSSISHEYDEAVLESLYDEEMVRRELEEEARQEELAERMRVWRAERPRKTREQMSLHQPGDGEPFKGLLRARQIDNGKLCVFASGEVVSCEPIRILTTRKSRCGLCTMVELGYGQNKRWVPVYQLVARAFLPPAPLDGCWVLNAKNGDWTDARAANLEWIPAPTARRFHPVWKQEMLRHYLANPQRYFNYKLQDLYGVSRQAIKRWVLDLLHEMQVGH